MARSPDPHQQSLARRPGSPRALARRQWLPKYVPELNDIEPVWRDLKAHHLAYQTFPHDQALDRAVRQGVSDLNRERMSSSLAKSRISA